VKRIMLERQIAGDLRGILSSYVQKQLSVLWKRESRNPGTWLVRVLAIFALLLYFWIIEVQRAKHLYNASPCEPEVNA
jgi:hypothetical protein